MKRNNVWKLIKLLGVATVLTVLLSVKIFEQDSEMESAGCNCPGDKIKISMTTAPGFNVPI